MPDLYIFKAQVGMFDPLALYNQNVAIHYVQKTRYRKVDFLEGIPPFQCISLAALGAVSVSARTNVINLEMPNNEFGLFRWYPIDDAQIRLYHPAGIAKFQLRRLQVPVDMNILFRDPNLVSTEIAVWEDNRPAIEGINGHAFALGAVRVIALGYRFHVVEFTKAMAKEAGFTNRQDGTGDVTALLEAFRLGKEPCTHVFCSGRGIGD